MFKKIYIMIIMHGYINDIIIWSSTPPSPPPRYYHLDRVKARHAAAQEVKRRAAAGSDSEDEDAFLAREEEHEGMGAGEEVREGGVWGCGCVGLGQWVMERVRGGVGVWGEGEK